MYNPSAAAAIGMVLAAKDDRMPDCITRPEPVWADAPEAEEAVEEENAPQEEAFFVPDATFSQGEQGTLIPEEEYGEKVEQPVEKPKKEKKPKEKKPKAPPKPRMTWIKDLSSKVKTGVLNFYDEMTREEEEENNPKVEK